MGSIHVRSPFVLLGYNYLKFYWFDQSSMGSLTHQLFSNQFMPSPLGIELLARPQLIDWGPAGPLDPLGVGFDFIFQVTGCAQLLQSHDVFGIMDDDIVQPHGSMECYAGCCACLSHVWTTIPRRCISAP